MKMPYLHWETSRRQGQLACEIDKIVQRSTGSLLREEAEAKNKRQAQRDFFSPATINNNIPAQPTPSPPILASHSISEGLEDLVAIVNQDNGKEEAGPFKSENALGCYLLVAARLYESMTTYRDRKLLHKYFSHDPPIHP